MPGSADDTGRRFALDYCTTTQPVGEPNYDFWNDLAEMWSHAERVIAAGRFKLITFHERGTGPFGWTEIDRLTVD